MVSFVCNHCQETLKKAKLDNHFNRCYNAQFTCIDCNTDFQGNSYRNHTSCISEAEKYQKSVYKGKKHTGNNLPTQIQPPNKVIKFNEVKVEKQNFQPKAEVQKEEIPLIKENEVPKVKKAELTVAMIENEVQTQLKKKGKLPLSKLSKKVYKALKKDVALKIDEEKVSIEVIKSLGNDLIAITQK